MAYLPSAPVKPVPIVCELKVSSSSTFTAAPTAGLHRKGRTGV